MEVKKENMVGAADSEVGMEKRSLWQTIQSFGPGIIFVLTALGAGDLVDASVAGSHYGYSLMWVLALATIVRFVIVNIMARFDLCNTKGMTLLQGFSRLHKFYPYFFAVFTLFLGHLLNATMIKGSGEALSKIFHFGSPLMWGIIAVVFSFFTAGHNVYHKLEVVMKVILSVMTLAFISLAIFSKPDVGEILKGTVGFGLPEGTGVYGALMITISLTGAVAGSLTNFLYPHSMREKGWTSPSHKRLQRNELLFSICILILLNLAIWVVGAEILRPNGIEVKSLDDISKALEIHLGYFGPTIFYLGVLGALYSTIIGVAAGFSKIAVENIQIIDKSRREKYGDKFENDPIYKKISLFFLITPIVWSLPGMPGFVVLTIVANMFNTIALPSIAIGLVILSNKKEYLGKYTNNIFENVILIGATLLAVWGAIKIIMGFLS